MTIDRLFEYQRDGDELRAVFDTDAVSPTTAVLRVIEEAAGKDLLELDTLYSYVDPDALEMLLEPREEATGDVRIHFSMDKYAVCVTNYGRITVRPATAVDRRDDR